jgi:UrcA family protein
MKIRSAILAAALGAAMFSAPAMAAPADGGALAVQYKDLDLSTPAGMNTLNQRLEKAAREVCGVGQTITGSRIPSKTARLCFDETLAQLHQQIAGLGAKPVG